MNTAQFIPTQRTYTNHLTGEVFRMYADSYTHATTLINENTGKECKTFYVCAFTGTDVKDNKGKVYNLGSNEFIDTSNVRLTHKKFFIQKRFVKI